MRPEKQALAQEYLARLHASPFVITVNYQGLNVAQFAELRRRLAEKGSEAHVVKNTIFRLAAREAGLPEFSADAMTGQVACLTGAKDISAAAKVVKEFNKEFKRPEFLAGCLGDEVFDRDALERLADLPPMDVLRATLLGTLMAPATNLVRLLNTPATQLARVLQARADKQQAAA
ncbi:MAG: 50S ribosomal protein L10 [Verrucomicrobiales bacterium]|nr:50S ribosomal protein L10 [Verrucomicrobiales bacterium]